MDEDPEVAARKAMLSWLKDQVNADLADAPAALWHYTDAGGLKGILESNRLWATNTRFLNDSQEILHGSEMARKVLAEVDLANRAPETRAFLRALGNGHSDEAIIQKFLAEHLEVFVTCFCEDGDLLSQWRAYTGNQPGDGYAIKFMPPGALPAWAQSAPGGHELSLAKVIYDEDQQQAALEDLLSRLIDVLDAKPVDSARIDGFAKAWLDGVIVSASRFKHSAFAEEKEWRIVYVRNRSPQSAPLDIHHRTARGLLVPYVELNVPEGVGPDHNTLPIDTINCGPSPEPGLKQRGARSLIKAIGTSRTIGVEGSLAPLRV